MTEGLASQWMTMLPYVMAADDIEAHVVEVHPHRAGGRLERLPVPQAVARNTRLVLSSGPLFRLPRLDAVWANDIRSAMPFLLTRGLLERTRLITMIDATIVQLADFGPFYNKKPNEGLRGRLRNALDSACYRRASLVNPVSVWAARSLHRDHGVARTRIHVVPFGIDLARWQLVERRRSPDRPVRLLFVGGNFRAEGWSASPPAIRRSLAGRL